MSTGVENRVDALNRSCDCGVVDLAALRSRLERSLADDGVVQPLVESHPHLFSDTPVFIDTGHVAGMQRIIDGVERVVRTPAYQREVLARAPAISRIDRGPSGVFMGFDFHITASGPRLIEINTNAGGALLNIAGHTAHRACCNAADEHLASQPTAAQLEEQIVAMFEREWQLARGGRPLRTIAIVDESPRGQFLYPEFVLAKRLFEARGYKAFILDPAELELAGDCIRFAGERVDLVYNRLTDFYLAAPGNHVLRAALERDLAVITPHPHAHALYANKENLTIFSDAAKLAGLGVARSGIDSLLHGIPTTRHAVGCEDAWWRERKDWFFKPSRGFGSRGTYRGDKLTRRVFAQVMNGEYVAQKYVPAGERLRTTPRGRESFKVDVRCFVYAGQMQGMAARMYQGQTTNFRSAGGGFAPVYVVPCEFRTTFA